MSVESVIGASVRRWVAVRTAKVLDSSSVNLHWYAFIK
jgi:hypothetical protein